MPTALAEQWVITAIATLGTVVAGMLALFIKDRFDRAREARDIKRTALVEHEQAKVDLQRVLNERIDGLLTAHEHDRQAMQSEIDTLKGEVRELKGALKLASDEKHLAESTAAIAQQQLAIANSDLLQMKQRAEKYAAELHECEEARRRMAEAR